MKFTPILALTILIFSSSCTTSRKSLSIRYFQQQSTNNLVQVSDFTITTSIRDTLYIKTENEIGVLLYEMWKIGAYEDTDPNCCVIGVNSAEFQKLMDKAIARN